MTSPEWCPACETPHVSGHEPEECYHRHHEPHDVSECELCIVKEELDG